MNLTNWQKLITAILLLLIVVGLIVGVWWWIQRSRLSSQPSITPPNTNKVEVPPPPVVVKAVDFKKLPEYIPTDLPLDPQRKIVQNFSASSDQARSQSTQVYETGMSVADSFSLYQGYLSTHGWTIDATSQLDNSASLVAQKNRIKLVITASRNTVSQINTVNITVVDLGPTK